MFQQTWGGVVRSFVCVGVLLSALVAGCVSQAPGTAPGRAPVSPSQMLNESAAGKKVEEARHFVTAGENSIAIPRLLQVISCYPDTRASLEARYLLGITYYNIKSYKDAVGVFQEYQRLAPSGTHAKEAADYIQRVSDEYNQKFPGPEVLDARITELKNQLRANPENVGQQMELAELLWKRGDYSDAGRIYVYIIERHPEYAQDAAVNDRIERLPQGGYIALTPTEVQRRQIREQPLEIINQNSFRSGRDLITREDRYYVVTGQVLNRGDSVLYGVQVNITIYGFGGVVYDTNTVTLGRMNPGETRAFSTRFSDFENMDNIDRFNCVSTFQR